MYFVKTYTGKQLEQSLKIINEMVIAHYKSFPFLYCNQGESLPNHIFMEDPNGFILFAENKEKKVGLFAGVPLNSPLLDVKYSPFPKINEMKAKGFNINKILYAAAFFVTNEVRENKELILEMFKRTSEVAKKMGKEKICFFTTIREDNHPLKPAHFVPPEPWEELPILCQDTGIRFNLTWPTLQKDGSIKEEVGEQAIYIMEILS